jgi:hypothetical protein
MRTVRTFGLVVLIVAFASLLGCGNKSAGTGPTAQLTPSAPQSEDTTPRKKSTDTGSAAHPKPGPGESPKKSDLGEPKYRVSVKGILDEFATDPKGASAKYQGEIIELSGTTTDHAILGKTVWLQPDAAGYGYLWTLAFLDELDGKYRGLGAYGRDLSVIGKVFTGQQVKIKGRLKVDSSNNSPQLSEAEITEIGPDTSVRMTASELAMAAVKDGDALEKRCKGKSLVVSGTVVGMVKKDLVEYVELKGEAETKVLCTLGLSDYFYDKGFQPGEHITFVGELNSLQSSTVYVWKCVPVNRLPK